MDVAGFLIGVAIAAPVVALLILVTRRWWADPDDPGRHKPNGPVGE